MDRGSCCGRARHTLGPWVFFVRGPSLDLDDHRGRLFGSHGRRSLEVSVLSLFHRSGSLDRRTDRGRVREVPLAACEAVDRSHRRHICLCDALVDLPETDPEEADRAGEVEAGHHTRHALGRDVWIDEVVDHHIGHHPLLSCETCVGVRLRS